MKKKILGMSDAWSTSPLSHRSSEPAYYIVDCRIYGPPGPPAPTAMEEGVDNLLVLDAF